MVFLNTIVFRNCWKVDTWKNDIKGYLKIRRDFMLTDIVWILCGTLIGFFIAWTIYIVHELGHALAGWIVRAKIRAVAAIPFLYKDNKLSIVNIKPFKKTLLGNLGLMGWVDLRFPIPDNDNKKEIFLAKLKIIFIIICGPLFQIIYSLIIVKLCLGYFVQDGMYTGSEKVILIILIMVIGENILIFIANGYIELFLAPFMFLKEKRHDIIIKAMEQIFSRLEKYTNVAISKHRK